MPTHSISLQARRRTGRRYTILLFVIFAVVAGWIGLWKYAAARASQAIAEWRAHEAAAGRIFTCANESITGFPFRLEVTCSDARAEFRDFQPALELALPRVLTVAQIYDPNRLISEFDGPLQFSAAGRQEFEVAWSLGQASVSGLVSQPNRVSVVFNAPVLTYLAEGGRDSVFKARSFEVHGRPAHDGGAPGIEAGLRFEQALIPVWPAAAAQPFDAVINTVIHGMTDLAPKPWLVRLRELQAAGSAFEIKQARVVQGDILAVGHGTLRFNAAGHLDGQLRLTVAGLEILLDRIGAKQVVQTSPAMDKIAGALDLLAPGLGNVARQQVGANVAPGIKALGEQTTLEGRKAVSVPLRFDNGAVFLGPIPLGQMPAGL